MIPDVTASITDNDSAGVLIVQPLGGINLTEGSGKDTYGVLLTTAPTANVTINFDTGNSNNPPPLTFTPNNWNVAQNISIEAIDDGKANETRNGIITHKSVSTDTKYNNLTIPPITATVTDNDIASVSISPTSTIAVQGGAKGSYKVKLTSQPTQPVTISFATGSQVDAIAPIIFDATNWNVAKSVTVTATDDDFIEDEHLGAIAHTATSGDTKYN